MWERNGTKNYFLLYFFRNSKHIFCFDKSQIFLSPNDVMRFINTKNKKIFFSIFLTENHNTNASALLSTCKKYTAFFNFLAQKKKGKNQILYIFFSSKKWTTLLFFQMKPSSFPMPTKQTSPSQEKKIETISCLQL